ncbi:MAG: helix-turn-helix domain-containing protein [Acidobacteriota bacterium]|nr:helix-turn-helix domain-containing protein [Acidobacteriota bacterium]
MPNYGLLTGDLLKDKRIRLNMTQEQLAEAFGVSATTLARWERGEIIPNAIGMLELAFEALEAKQLLGSDAFRKSKEQAERRINGSVTKRVRQRVRSRDRQTVG